MISWIHAVSRRLAKLFRPKRAESELDRELSFHLQESIEQNLQSGMSPDEARNEALRAFGTFELLKEDCRDNWGTRLLFDFARDLNLALRRLRKSPGFAFVAIASLSIAIPVRFPDRCLDSPPVSLTTFHRCPVGELQIRGGTSLKERQGLLPREIIAQAMSDQPDELAGEGEGMADHFLSWDALLRVGVGEA